MRGAKFLVCIGAVFAQPALACSVVLPQGYEGSAKQVRNVRETIARSAAVIDGEVIRQFVPGRQNALVRVHRVLKGSVRGEVEVGEESSCDIPLDQLGERSRMILYGGPMVFRVVRDQSEARIEDRLLKSDRRKVWPYFAGQPASTK